MVEGTANVELTVVKRKEGPELFRIVSQDDTAKAGKDYTGLNDVITMKAAEKERKILIAIVDDDEWEPDKDFFVKLCAADSSEQE